MTKFDLSAYGTHQRDATRSGPIWGILRRSAFFRRAHATVAMFASVGCAPTGTLLRPLMASAFIRTLAWAFVEGEFFVIGRLSFGLRPPFWRADRCPMGASDFVAIAVRRSPGQICFPLYSDPHSPGGTRRQGRVKCARLRFLWSLRSACRLVPIRSSRPSGAAARRLSSQA
jgi:hypothetical protein